MREKKDRYADPVENKVEEFRKQKSEETKEKAKDIFIPYKVESTIPKLRVHEAPNVDAEEMDYVTRGQSVTIVEEKDGWGKTKFSGWVNLKYARRV